MAMRITDWDDFIGHKNIIRFIKRQLETNSVRQVILFQGKAGIGKSSMAKLLAIELTTKGNPELRRKYVETVIHNNQSTDSIKLFSMSNIRDKDEEILKVKSEMNTSFSSTGMKVLILDEAQGISTKAQDSILIELEHLPRGVYVVFCTTESGIFSEACESRLMSPFYLSDLTQGEAQQLIKRCIDERNLRFELSTKMVLSLICSWTKNQPRKALNLLENFEVGSYVSVKDLEVFINNNSDAAMVELLKYLYGSLAMGLDYIENLKYDNMFATSLIELCKVAMGGKSDMFSQSNTVYIHEFMVGRDIKYIVQFTARVAGLQYITKRQVVAAFIQSHIAYKQEPPVKCNTPEMKVADLRTMAENVKHDTGVISSSTTPNIMSLDMLLAQAEVLD